VTRVAVSRQVKLLEGALNIKLFLRGRRHVELTREGRKLSRVVSNSFQSIADELESIQNASDERLITLATSSGVSTYWLMPTIGRYRAIAPQVDFRLLVSYDLLNLVQSGVDIAIRYGQGNWQGVQSQLLQRQMIFPACSQSFMKRYGPFEKLEDLLKVPLLDYEAAADESSFWPGYFRDMGLSTPSFPRMSSYDSYINFVQAVLDGQGVGLMGPPLMQEFLDSGVLVRALDVEPLSQRGYYLCQPKGVAVPENVRHFHQWLSEELGKTSTSHSYKHIGRSEGLLHSV